MHGSTLPQLASVAGKAALEAAEDEEARKAERAEDDDRREDSGLQDVQRRKIALDVILYRKAQKCYSVDNNSESLRIGYS